MPRYMVERTFPGGLQIPVTEEGAAACLGVTWVPASVGADQRTARCRDDGPSPAAIRTAAEGAGLPVDQITTVSVLAPYCYR